RRRDVEGEAALLPRAREEGLELRDRPHVAIASRDLRSRLGLRGRAHHRDGAACALVPHAGAPARLQAVLRCADLIEQPRELEVDEELPQLLDVRAAVTEAL